MFKMNNNNLPEIKELFKEVIEAPEKIFEMFRIDMRAACEKAVTELIKTELAIIFFKSGSLSIKLSKLIAIIIFPLS